MQNRFTWADQALWYLVRLIVAIFPIGFGAVVLTGGTGRFSGPAFAAMQDWAPYWIWGFSLLASGLLALHPYSHARTLGYLAVSGWYWIWEAGLMLTVADPVRAFTGVYTYFAVALVYTGFAVANFMDRERS